MVARAALALGIMHPRGLYYATSTYRTKELKRK